MSAVKIRSYTAYNQLVSCIDVHVCMCCYSYGPGEGRWELNPETILHLCSIQLVRGDTGIIMYVLE